MSEFAVAVVDDDEVPLTWVLDELAADGTTLVVEKCRTEDDLKRVAHGSDVIVIVVAPLTAAVLDAIPECRVVLKAGVGTDTIDLDAARARGVAVANVGNYCAVDVAEHALALALALVRKLPAANRQVRSGTWDRRLVVPVRRFSSLTLGVIGLGAIGTSLAERWEALGGAVHYFDPYRASAARWPERSLEELLRGSDVISLHVPLTPETRGLIGVEEIALMQRGALLVNTSRGETVDSAAVREALATGHLGGAGLDVWSPEPIPDDDGVLSAPNVAVTAHYAGYSEESFDDLRQRVLNQIRQVRAGEVPRWTLNGVTALRPRA
jgi:D-3-phosphoglycerate dehydrogenase